MSNTTSYPLHFSLASRTWHENHRANRHWNLKSWYVKHFPDLPACLPAHVICRVLMGEAKFKSEVLNQRLYLNIWHALSCLHHSTPGLSIAYKDGLWFPTMKEKITLLFCDEVIQGAFSLSLVVEIPTKDSMMAKPTRTINKSRSS